MIYGITNRDERTSILFHAKKKKKRKIRKGIESVLRALRKLSNLLCVNFFVFTKVTFRKKAENLRSRL
jgi:methyltransferase-like protein